MWAASIYERKGRKSKTAARTALVLHLRGANPQHGLPCSNGQPVAWRYVNHATGRATTYRLGASQARSTRRSKIQRPVFPRRVVHSDGTCFAVAGNGSKSQTCVP